MNPTIHDVARVAGVSAPTVSRVLANKQSVDPLLRRRVLDAVRDLNYRPHRAARALRSQVSRTIAFIIPDIQNQFFTSVLRGVEDAAFAADYVVLLCNTDDSLERQRAHIDVLRAENIAGMVICPADETHSLEQINAARQQGIAAVVVDRQLLNADIDSVMTNNSRATEEAIRYLLDMGHTRIGIISGPEHFAPGRERLRGYQQALGAAGTPVDPDLVRVTDFRPDAAASAARALLDRPAQQRPTALFVTSCRVALAVLAVVGDLGLRIPQDLSIVAYDDPDWAVGYQPALTVVAQPTYEMGRHAINMLLARINDPSLPPVQLRLPSQLLVRRSCRALRTELAPPFSQPA